MQRTCEIKDYCGKAENNSNQDQAQRSYLLISAVMHQVVNFNRDRFPAWRYDQQGCAKFSE